MAVAYLCLGSNSGDKLNNLQKAVSLLVANKTVSVVRSSAPYETEPWGNKNLDWFVNAVIEVKTKLSPRELLELCKNTEIVMGRKQSNSKTYEARNIDIDILFYGDLTIDEPDLKIPHPHLHERAFAIVPLLELIPDYEHPKYKKSLLQMHDDLETLDDVYLYGTRAAI
ncbi:MAG: 2-amino-4-hydroxy-6-hydroxymethyldihydropteridine diphosphokinase [Candidatus Gastranaerophilales bacterium]|nr:2-amino-4-hydroxy-6-hydroxymethyldihydropteridine diphosphokinase [Candidatus Gastranaerophilales bacterium]